MKTKIEACARAAHNENDGAIRDLFARTAAEQMPEELIEAFKSLAGVVGLGGVESSLIGFWSAMWERARKGGDLDQVKRVYAAAAGAISAAGRTQ